MQRWALNFKCFYTTKYQCNKNKDTDILRDVICYVIDIAYYSHTKEKYLDTYKILTQWDLTVVQFLLGMSSI